MIVERIVRYLEAKGMAVSAFEREAGLGNGTLSRAYRNGTAIGTDKLEKILSVCDDLSPLWVVTGRGDMFSVDHCENSLSGSAVNVENVHAVFITNWHDIRGVVEEAVKNSLKK